jgi:hypothetical protein
MQNQNLGIALFSYCGALHWGFNADWESFPDVHEFVEELEASFLELKELAASPSIEARSTTKRTARFGTHRA